MTDQFTLDTTEGWNRDELAEMNIILKHRLSLLDEDERENDSIIKNLREQVTSDYDAGREMVPSFLVGGEGEEIEVSGIYDLQVRHSPTTGRFLAVVALISLSGSGFSADRVLAAIYPDGAVITQGDWQTPEDEIPEDLSAVRWQHAPTGNTSVVVFDDGLPRLVEPPRAPGGYTTIRMYREDRDRLAGRMKYNETMADAIHSLINQPVVWELVKNNSKILDTYEQSREEYKTDGPWHVLGVLLPFEHADATDDGEWNEYGFNYSVGDDFYLVRRRL